MIKKCIFFSEMDFSFCLNTLNRSVQQPPYCLWILLAENFVTLQKNSLLLNFKEKRGIQGKLFSSILLKSCLVVRCLLKRIGDKALVCLKF